MPNDQEEEERLDCVLWGSDPSLFGDVSFSSSAILLRPLPSPLVSRAAAQVSGKSSSQQDLLALAFLSAWRGKKNKYVGDDCKVQEAGQNTTVK